jgi:uncharacterized protein YjdB
VIRRSLLVGLASVGAVLAAVSCDLPTGACTSDLRISYSPPDTTIAVGQQFAMSLMLFGCGGRTPLTDTITFHSSDTTIAHVEMNSGLVTGRSSGTAVITGSAAHYHLDIPATVHVR